MSIGGVLVFNCNYLFVEEAKRPVNIYIRIFMIPVCIFIEFNVNSLFFLRDVGVTNVKKGCDVLLLFYL